MKSFFSHVARSTTAGVGSPIAFVLALGVIILWGVLGPIFDFSDTWQLVINTSTTIVTFLMVFLIQNAQNRDSKALHLKLDEIIFAQRRASNRFIDIENMDDDEIDRLHEQLEEQVATRKS